MPAPTDRTYLDTHEWHKLDGDVVAIGISQVAVEELTDITFVEVAQTDGPIAAGESFGEIESVKATSELYCGIDGEVVEVNAEVIENPALINEDPYERGWIIKVRAADPAQVTSLIAAADYDAAQAG